MASPSLTEAQTTERDEWGEWECPMCMDGKKYSDPDSIRGTTCDAGHVILLGPVDKYGYRWAERYENYVAE